MTDVRSVLIVDDSAPIAEELRKLVEGLEGYSVAGIGGDGAEGIKLFRELKPDVVMMDAVMPVLNGWEATRAILEIDPEARVVIFSAVGDLKQMKGGAKASIEKPFTAEKIAQALSTAFGE